jgi:aliphatic nitrilase
MSENETVFRVAAVQMSPVLFDRDGTTDKVVSIIEKCGREGIRLAVFPETIVPNYPYFAFVQPPIQIHETIALLFGQAVDVPGPVTDAVGKAARKAGCVVVLGVNERDGGSLYNTQLIFDADGTLLGKRRKIMPTFHERMIWGWGDGSGLRVFETAAGRVGALICWEHYMPLARYALMTQGEQIHCAHFPGSMSGRLMSRQLDAAIRHHAMESGAFVVNATGWLTEEQRAEISPDESIRGALQGGNCTAVISPWGEYLAGPVSEGEDMAIAEIDLNTIIGTKNILDTVGHYSRPDILRLKLDNGPQNVVEGMYPTFEEPGAISSEGPEEETEK